MEWDLDLSLFFFANGLSVVLEQLILKFILIPGIQDPAFHILNFQSSLVLVFYSIPLVILSSPFVSTTLF